MADDSSTQVGTWFVIVSWTSTALNNRKQIFEYIARDNLAAAEKLDQRIVQKTARLVDRSSLDRRGRVAGTRELVVHPNYIVIYQIAGDLIRVLRVMHVARRWPPARRSRG